MGLLDALMDLLANLILEIFSPNAQFIAKASCQ